MGSQEIGLEGVDGFDLAQGRDVTASTQRLSGCVKCIEFLYTLGNCQILKMGFSPWS